MKRSSIVLMLVALLVVLLVTSCKKDPPVEQPDFLTGDTSFFVGAWQWEKSSHNYGPCNNLNYSEQITPASSGNNSILIFYPNGWVQHYRNDTLIVQNSLYFIDYRTSSS